MPSSVLRKKKSLIGQGNFWRSSESESASGSSSSASSQSDESDDASVHADAE